MSNSADSNHSVVHYKMNHLWLINNTNISMWYTCGVIKVDISMSTIILTNDELEMEVVIDKIDS